ncbi:hypothetical protein F4820DRAFT_442346 [Hypoxylon rubiginosum]|uniref:Uncharacterized protein n=1 Tax=Hypoxylon rubiginosum TaxID=110542 RepID=A0ACB9YHR7_9PEZI|nr:hypothetical protein F4820DRAFT_442346 [Hypoxylon rubiginosum]
MAADSGRPGVRLAAQVYESRPRNDAPAALNHTSHTSPAAFSPSASPQAILLEPGATEANLYRQVLHLIRETGQFVDDISARYFQGIHRYLPVRSRTRFHKSLITLGAVPSAGFSALLLSICLATSSSRATNTRPFDRRSLHLATRSFLAQVQVSFRPSIYLIQARLLLAVYDYMRGRPDDAFASIAGCARMAYAARLHLYNHPSLQPPGFQEAATNVDTDVDTDLQLEAKEAANTWWGIAICERTFFCEVTIPEQPLVTVIPNGDALLPTEHAILKQVKYLDSNLIPRVAVSSLSSANIKKFSRTT